jgi:SPP1 gp7 family putative phage head morphogenesis protein
MSRYSISKATAPKYPPLGPTERAVRDALMFAVKKIQDKYVAMDVIRALERYDIDGAVEMVRFELGEEFLMSALPAHLRKAYELMGVAAAAEASRHGVEYAFNIISPTALDWIRENAGSLIRQWGESSRAALRQLIAQAFEEAIPYAKLARMIRDTGIGLTWRQARAVLMYRHRLAAEGVPASKIDAQAERYFKQLLKYRAEVIARTEITRAAEAARQEAWRQAIQRELLDPGRMEKEWLATNDARCCENCGDLDGTRAKMPDGHFVADGGTDGGIGPPLHPQCRCRTVAVPVGSKKMPRAKVNIPGDKGRR